MTPIDVRQLPGAGVTTMAEGQGYFPVLVATANGVLAVLRGGAGHFGIRGRLDLVSSADGAAFSAPRSIVDTAWDDRNPAFGVAADGGLVLAYHGQGSYTADGSWDRGARRIETRITRSRDGGASWDPAALLASGAPPGCSPYGRIITLAAGPAAGTMLLPLYGDTAAAPGAWDSWLVRSRDGGASFAEPTLVARGHSESSFVELPGGEVLGVLRSADAASSLALVRSPDGGASFGAPTRLTADDEHPGDALVLRDGRLLICFGRRHPPFGVRGLLSADGGASWQELLIWDASPTSDCGYPSAVQLPSGRVVIGFYEAGEPWLHRDGAIASCTARVVSFDERAL